MLMTRSIQETVSVVIRTPDAEDSFNAAFTSARPRLVRLAQSLVGPDAEDAVQDTYLIAREAYANLRDQSSLDAWLHRICVNRCFRFHRRRRILERLMPRLNPTGASSSLELRELIERLPASQRTVLVLHYGHGYSLLEIAGLLDISHENARAIASRARRRLVEQWTEAER